MSVSSDGAQANNVSGSRAISATGRYVLFHSAASNLVVGDTNNEFDAFVKDNQTGHVTRVSVASDGTEGTDNVRFSDISADGRWVAFSSQAPNLVPGDSGSSGDLFLHDRQTAVTTLVGNRLNSGDDVALSADGRYVAFEGFADDLVSGDTNGTTDVFVHDNATNVTTRVSVSSEGAQASGGDPAISDDGRYVAFSSSADNLVVNDINNAEDVFVHDRQTGTTTRASVTSAGTEALSGGTDPDISADGRYVSFTSAFNFVQNRTSPVSNIFVHDRQTATTTLASVDDNGTTGNASSASSSVSADGRYVAFLSDASNLVSGDTNSRLDVFVRDRVTSTTTRANVASDGSQAAFQGAGVRDNFTNTGTPRLSADGRYVAFDQRAANLVFGDTNGVADVFLRDTQGDPPPPVVSVGDTSAVERDSGIPVAARFTLSLSEPAASAVTVAYATSDGTATAPGDYTATSGTVSFAHGTTTQVVEVAINGDSDFEGNETFTLTLSDPAGATLGDSSAVGTIVDDDPTASVGDATVYEGDEGTRAAVFSVTLSKPAASTVTVDYATSDATATAGQDYTAKSGSLTFSPGLTSLPVKVPVAGDLTDEGSGQSFSLSLTAVSGAVMGDATGTGLVIDDDPDNRGGVRMAIGDVSIHEGDAGTRTALLNVSMSEPWTSTVTVNFATVKGSADKPDDFVGKSGKLSFAPGTTTLNVKVAINSDTLAEGNESLTVVLSGLTGGGTFISDGSGTLTILDND